MQSDIEEKLSTVISQGKRFLIAVDQRGIHFREVLCVTRRLEYGEVEYSTRPVLSGEGLLDVLDNGLQKLTDEPLSGGPLPRLS